MTAQRREVYQPSFDETPTYDLQDEEVEDARARLPLLIVIALLVLAAFAGVVWLAYNQGVESGRMGVPAIIAAPEGPARTAPDQQVAEEPITGLSVYEEPVAPEQEAAESTLAATPPPMELRPTEPAPVIVAAEPAPPPAPAVVAAPTPEPAPARPAPAPAAAAAPPPPAPVAVNTPPPAPAAAAASSAMASAGAVLQLGSYPSEALANNAWTTFRERHAAILGSLSSDVQVANIPDRGTWYRLRAGPYTDRASAVAACEALRSEGGTCLVLQP
jgi:cell division protein FtsN